MDPHRLRLLVELSRRKTMHAVAEELGYTTSTVSQQLKTLAAEAGTPLIERSGRMVRLTPAGQRLAGHAVTVLAALDAARADLDPAAEPAGQVRVAAFASGIRDSLLPVVAGLAQTHPGVEVHVLEHEAPEALALLADDAVDLALVYDYNLAPRSFPQEVAATRLSAAKWNLAVAAGQQPRRAASAPEVFRRYADTEWIINSRDVADQNVILAIAALAGFMPRFTHRADSLDLVQHLVAAGLGVGLLAADEQLIDGVQSVRLTNPQPESRTWVLVRRGREKWAPLALVIRALQQHSS